jgi:hypothetical protein
MDLRGTDCVCGVLCDVLRGEAMSENDKDLATSGREIWKPTDPGTGITPPVLPKEGDTSGDQSQEEPSPQPSQEKHFGDEAIWQAEKDESRTDPPSIPDQSG